MGSSNSQPSSSSSVRQINESSSSSGRYGGRYAEPNQHFFVSPSSSEVEFDMDNGDYLNSDQDNKTDCVRGKISTDSRGYRSDSSVISFRDTYNSASDPSIDSDMSSIAPHHISNRNFKFYHPDRKWSSWLGFT
jgi:hypothetical protein